MPGTNRGPFVDKGSVMKLITFITCGILFLTIACDDEAVMICDSLDVNFTGLRAELNQKLSGLQPKPTEEDPTGHLNNLTFFVERLKSECNLDASIRCYACIYTYPPQSEVKIVSHISGDVVTRVLDIKTPDSGVMTVVNIHH